MFLRVKILFILLFFIQSRIAHGINIHYCGNLVADLSYLHDAEGCDMHNSKSEKDCHISQKTCCLDKVLVYDKNQIENESISFSLFNSVKDQFILGDLLFANKNILLPIPESPPPKLPVFKKNCSFIFYG
tara:strand:- start:319 stop:708 length:390 start_codon:yes stop_codon:yes gene_type:complete